MPELLLVLPLVISSALSMTGPLDLLHVHIISSLQRLHSFSLDNLCKLAESPYDLLHAHVDFFLLASLLVLAGPSQNGSYEHDVLRFATALQILAEATVRPLVSSKLPSFL